MVKPTVGKRLWYWPTRATAPDKEYDLSNQPLAAHVTHVNLDGTVNICYSDRNGQPDRRITVQLWQIGMPRPMGNFCEYHPDDLPGYGDKVAIRVPVSQSHKLEDARPKLAISKKTG